MPARAPPASDHRGFRGLLQEPRKRTTSTAVAKVKRKARKRTGDTSCRACLTTTKVAPQMMVFETSAASARRRRAPSGLRIVVKISRRTPRRAVDDGNRVSRILRTVRHALTPRAGPQLCTIGRDCAGLCTANAYGAAPKFERPKPFYPYKSIT